MVKCAEAQTVHINTCGNNKTWAFVAAAAQHLSLTMDFKKIQHHLISCELPLQKCNLINCKLKCKGITLHHQHGRDLSTELMIITTQQTVL